MNPRRLHSDTSFSMSMGYRLLWKRLRIDLALVFLFLPVTLDDAHGADLDAQRIAFQLWHDGEAIHGRRGADVLAFAQRQKPAAALAELERPLQHTAMILEAIPGQASAIIKADLHLLAQ